MGERTEYTPGTFCWADLTTTDQRAAKQFYGGLFGWQAEDFPVGDDMVYSIQRIDGKDVAAISVQPQQQRDMGVPPTWNSYVSVESADDTAARAAELGASVHAPPFDVMDVGRMAVIADPQGAFFEIWEPRATIGAQLVNVPGALAWNELASSDIDGSVSFYAGLFGWETRPFENSPQRYEVILNRGNGNGGIRPPSAGEPNYWLVYFATEDIDAGLARAEELGGTKLAGPLDIGIAKIGLVRDPQGAVFALYAGDLAP